MERLTHKARYEAGYKLNKGVKEWKAADRLGAYENTGLTPSEIIELKERDTAKEPIITGYNHAVGCKVGECPKCGTMSRDYMNFCNECGQRLKWEEK